MKKIILIVLVVCLLSLIGQIVYAERFERKISHGRKSTCDCQPENGGWVCSKCTCQGSNIVKDCHVGELISHPVCVCCGDCTLTDSVRMGVNIANIILRYLGVIALALFVLGGIIWITSAGAREQVQRGRKIITGAIVGMAIVLLAFLIVQTLMKALKIEEEYIPKGESAGDEEGWPKCPDSPTDTKPWCYFCTWTGSGGCQADAVKQLQALLNNEGCDCGPEDGRYGPLTRDCVKRFQSANGLAGTGKVGEATWAKYQGAHDPCP